MPNQYWAQDRLEHMVFNVSDGGDGNGAGYGVSDGGG